jgi:hypothetical protein
MPIGLRLDHDDGGDDDKQDHGHFIKPTEPNVAALIDAFAEFLQ